MDKYKPPDNYLEIIQLLTDDYSIKEIADYLKISIPSINKKLRFMREKLNAHSTIKVAAYCFRNGLIK